jgi:Zn-dependent alcohol dehydrogenase
MTRNKAKEVIEQMPERFQIDQLIEKLIFMEKVEEGLDDIKNNNLIGHDEVVKQASSWSKK